jgi:hypothetical protein
MRWAGQVAGIGEMRNVYKSILVGNSVRKRPLGKPGSKWWIILKWILRRYDGVLLARLIRLRIGPSGGLL